MQDSDGERVDTKCHNYAMILSCNHKNINENNFARKNCEHISMVVVCIVALK